MSEDRLVPRHVVEPNKPVFLTEGHAPGLTSRLGSLPRDNPQFEVAPGLISSDPRWLKFVEDLAHAYVTNIPQDVPDRGVFKGSGVDPSSSITKMATISGFPMLPQGAPFVRSYEQRTSRMTDALEAEIKERGSSEKLHWQEWDGPERHALDFIVKKYVRTGTTSRVYIKAHTNAGLPFGMKSPLEKQRLLEMWEKQTGKIVTMIKLRQWRSLYKAMNIVFGNISANRQQNDGMVLDPTGPISWVGQNYSPKERPAFDALRDEFVMAQKLVSLNGRSYQRKRTRPVAGTSLGAALPAFFVSHAVLDRMYADPIYKGGDKHLLYSKLRLGRFSYVWTGDVEVSDMTQPRAALRVINSALLSAFGMAGLLSVFPSSNPLLAVGQGRGVWYGDPFDEKTWNLSYVIASGDPGTTWKTTLLNTAHLFGAMVRAGMISGTHEEYDGLLSGSHPDYACYVVGDNMCVSSHSTMPDIDKFFGKVSVGRESAVTGLVFVENSGGGLDLVHDIGNWMSKIHPENPILTPRNRYPGVGYAAQRDIYSDHPMADLAYEIQDRVSHDAFGTSLAKMFSDIRREPSHLEGMSAIELRTLLEPRRIHYEDVTPATIDRLEREGVFVKVTEGLYEAMFKLFTDDPPDWAESFINRG